MTKKTSTRVAGRGGDKPHAKKRKPSSKRWLERHLSDPYVVEARRTGYRSRAAFKLMELDDRFRLLRPGLRVVDLGAAPGGWTQVAVARTGAGKARGGRVVAIDRAVMDPVAGALSLTADVGEDDKGMVGAVTGALGGPADVVLSDMAPATIGHAGADHLRIVALAENAFGCATRMLAPGGAFVCKMFQGGTEAALLADIKRAFTSVRHVKPKSSRTESAEIYLVATGFRRTPSSTDLSPDPPPE